MAVCCTPCWYTGLHPLPFHVLAILAHAVASMLVFGLCQHLFAVLEDSCSAGSDKGSRSVTAGSLQQQQPSKPSGRGFLQQLLMWEQQPQWWWEPSSAKFRAQALLAGLMFALHPIHTEVGQETQRQACVWAWQQVATVDHGWGMLLVLQTAGTIDVLGVLLLLLLCRLLQAWWAVLSFCVWPCLFLHCCASSWQLTAGMPQASSCRQCRPLPTAAAAAAATLGLRPASSTGLAGA